MPLGTSCSHKEELFCCAESNGPEKRKEKKSKDDSKFVNITCRSCTASGELNGVVSRNTANTKESTDGHT